MGFSMVKSLQATATPPSKNRVVGSRHLATNRVGQSPSQPVETASETSVTVTITVSGLPCWCSRDPVGEQDGPNVYAFVASDPINAHDYLGLDYVKYVRRSKKIKTGPRRFDIRFEDYYDVYWVMEDWQKWDSWHVFPKRILGKIHIGTRGSETKLGPLGAPYWEPSGDIALLSDFGGSDTKAELVEKAARSVISSRKDHGMGSLSKEQRLAAVKSYVADAGQVENPLAGGTIKPGHGLAISGYSGLGGGLGSVNVQLDNGENVLYGYWKIGLGVGRFKVATPSTPVYGRVRDVYDATDFCGSFVGPEGSFWFGASAAATPGGGASSVQADVASPGAAYTYQWYWIIRRDRECDTPSPAEPVYWPRTDEEWIDAIEAGLGIGR